MLRRIEPTGYSLREGENACAGEPSGGFSGESSDMLFAALGLTSSIARTESFEYELCLSKEGGE